MNTHQITGSVKVTLPPIDKATNRVIVERVRRLPHYNGRPALNCSTSKFMFTPTGGKNRETGHKTDLSGSFTIAFKEQPRTMDSIITQLHNRDDGGLLSTITEEESTLRRSSAPATLTETQLETPQSCPRREIRTSEGCRTSLTDSLGHLNHVLPKLGTDGTVRNFSTASVVGPVVYNKLQAAERLKVPPQRTKRKTKPDSAETDEEAKEMVSHFATQLSPEGKLATMKGYEDILEAEIRRKFQPHLRRRSTPNLLKMRRNTIPAASSNMDLTSTSVDLPSSSMNIRLQTAVEMLDTIEGKKSRTCARYKGRQDIVKVFTKWTNEWRNELEKISTCS